MENHQASEQMVGYLYQVRYALQLLLDHDNTNYQVSIEKFDDVAFDEDGSPRELIQLKHHVNNGGSLSDSSTDLWRTLKVWIDMISSDPTVLNDADFCLITTSSAPEGSVADMLCKKDRDIAEIYNKLIQVTKTSKNKDNKNYYDALSSADETRIKQLLTHIIVITNANSISDSENKIRKLIRYSCDSKHEDFVFERLEGWWFRQAIAALCSDAPVYFNQRQIRSLIKSIRSEYDDNNLPIDEDILMLDNILEEDLAPEQRVFLEQLRLLNLRSSQLKSALLDYYRAYKQRARWVRTELLYMNDLISYERRLIDAWQEAYDWMLEDLEELAEIDEKQKVKAGRALYKSLMGKDIRIRQNCGEPFVMKGSFHLLANDLRIGWHVDFVDRLQHILVPSEGE